MAEVPKHKACKQAPKCEVSKDGRCLEGLALTECPHFFWTKDPIETESVEKQPTIVVPQVHLLSGEEWRIDNLKIVMSQYSTKKIFIIGDSDSGKTTLLIRLFSAFQHAPFKDYIFAGSTTLLGFERRIHLSKVESDVEDEKTEKTNSKEFSFLHLALKVKDNLQGTANHLLLSDISGERIQLARDSSDEMKELALLRNADFVLIVLDGAKVADLRLRVATILKSQTFLRKALDDGIISTQQKVRIILSKWDLVSTSDGFNFENDIVVPFRSLFENRVPNLKFQQICTRSSQPNMIESTFGLTDLLNDWCEPVVRPVDRSKFSNQKSSTRAMMKYFVPPTI